MPVLWFLQQNPIIVDVGERADPTADISIEFVLGMFSLAGVLLLAAAVGGVIVALVVVVYKRRRTRLDTSETSTSHTRLGL